MRAGYTKSSYTDNQVQTMIFIVGLIGLIIGMLLTAGYHATDMATLRSMQRDEGTMIADCEANMPRTEFCAITAVPVGKESDYE